VDVARKALILARILGSKMELEDIKLKGLYPQSMGKLSAEDFLQQVHTLDGFYKEQQEKAKKENKVLRFVAKVTKQTSSVGLQAVDAVSEIGSLRGPDNLIIFKTKRYFKNPLIIKGPGAGIEVTAAGVFANVLLASDTL
jgi:homoserine dehydrogenase